MKRLKLGIWSLEVLFFSRSLDCIALHFNCLPRAAVSDAWLLVSCSLDALLDSGLYTGELTELSGGPGSGKSQVSCSSLPSPSRQPLFCIFFSLSPVHKET